MVVGISTTVEDKLSKEDTAILALRKLWNRSWGWKLISNHIENWTQEDVCSRFNQLLLSQSENIEFFVMELVVVYSSPSLSKQFVVIVTGNSMMVLPCTVGTGVYCIHPGLQKLSLTYREDLDIGISSHLLKEFLVKNMASSMVKMIGGDLDNIMVRSNITFHIDHMKKINYSLNGNNAKKVKTEHIESDDVIEVTQEVNNALQHKIGTPLQYKTDTGITANVQEQSKLRKKGAKPKSLGNGVGISKRRSPYLRFSAEEDSIIINLAAQSIQKHQPKDNKPLWNELLEGFLSTDPNRHSDQWPEKERNSVLRKMIRERYLYHLNPNISKTNFSPEEDMTIAAMYSVWGTKWSWMVKHIQGRTDNQIKNRWHFCVKKRFLDGAYDPLVVEVSVKDDIFLVAVTKDSLVTVPCAKDNNCTDNHFLPVFKVEGEQRLVAASSRSVGVELRYSPSSGGKIEKKVNPVTGYTLWCLEFGVEEEVMVIPGEVREMVDGEVGYNPEMTLVSQANQYKLMAQEKMICDRKKELMDERDGGKGKRKRYNLASEN